MRILQWVLPFLDAPGGRGVFVLDLVAELTRQGHHLGIIHNLQSNLPEEIASLPSVKIPYSEARGAQDRNLLPELIETVERFIHEFAPDVIHSHRLGEIDTLVLEKLSKKLKVPVVYTEHESPRFRRNDFEETRSKLASFAKEVIVPSRSMKSDFEATLPLWAGKTTVIPNGVPIRSKFVEPQPNKRIYFSGRHSSEKGLSVLLAAWPMVLSKEPKAELLIAGAGESTEDLQRLARLYGINSSVRWVGWTSRHEGRDLAASSLCVVVPSVWEEPFGLVAAEAAAEGRAVVASDTGGLREIVVHRQTGILVDAGDVIALGVALRSLISDPAWARALGKSGYDRISANFSLRGCAEAHVALYSRLVGRA